MTDDDLFSAARRSNVPEMSVSQLAQSLKRTLEDTYARVRVRGELCGLKLAASGHLYGDIKDADSNINIVCWRTSMPRLSIRPEDGLDVIVTGKMTSFPKNSRYQLVIESMELAGEGALLKLLEDRRKRLAAEGLFDPARKRRLPYLPDVIGVVTSPGGAVIRDILHRIGERFPRHVLLWPVAVQGEGAAQQIAAAIRGFNALPPGGEVPRPDLLIVARGGGSAEDLMAFNDEDVVRAAAASAIPLISAVGHETDTTLIDHAADLRAPTPTGAAERAVPVRLDLLGYLREQDGRMRAGSARRLAELRALLDTLTAKLGDPARLLESQAQSLDFMGEKLNYGFQRSLQARADRLTRLIPPPPGALIAEKTHFLTRTADLLRHGAERSNQMRAHRLAGLQLRPPAALIDGAAQRTVLASAGLARGRDTLFKNQEKHLLHAGRMLESLSFHKVLERGFAVIRAPDGRVIPTLAAAAAEPALEIEFADGRLAVQK